jgi:hypothetical protein
MPGTSEAIQSLPCMSLQLTGAYTALVLALRRQETQARDFIQQTSLYTETNRGVEYARSRPVALRLYLPNVERSVI